MKIENEKIVLKYINLDQARLDGKLIGIHSRKTFPLEAQSIEILEMLHRQFSVSEIVENFLKRRILISFSRLKDLLQFLLEEQWIQNPNLQSYFDDNKETEPSSWVESFLEKWVAKKTEAPSYRSQIQSLPFFRSLHSDLVQVFLENAKVVEAPAGLQICREGDQQRSLFALISGQAAVYRRNSLKKRKKVATLTEGSVFGEVGFFFNEPRTADIVTEKQSCIVRFRYVPEVFDELIQTSKAKDLRTRFWLVHALLKSDLFRHLPDNCFDAILFSGQLRTIPVGTLICREGDEGRSCYIIAQGTAVVSQGQQRIRVLQQGDCFGEMALMLTAGRRTASVVAQTELVVLELAFENFYKLLAQNLFLAAELEELALRRAFDDRKRLAASS